MAASDVLNQASAPFQFWDGSLPPFQSSQSPSNAPSQKGIGRLLNTYDAGMVASTELAQSIIVGPKPIRIAASTFTLLVSSLALLDTTSNTVTVTLPPYAYDGMKCVVKDAKLKFATNAGGVAVTGSGVQLETSGGVYGTSESFGVNATCIVYVYDGVQKIWMIESFWN